MIVILAETRTVWRSAVGPSSERAREQDAPDQAPGLPGRGLACVVREAPVRVRAPELRPRVPRTFCGHEDCMAHPELRKACVGPVRRARSRIRYGAPPFGLGRRP